MVVVDLGVMPYRDAWNIQEETHERVVAGGEETLLVVEHPAVVTLGRREESVRNLKVSPEELARRGVELVHSDRGGDITFHGPGQIVFYPIVRLAAHGLSVSGYVHRLEAIVISALARLEILAHADPAAVGVWTRDGDTEGKICAIGVRIRRGVSLHGVAVNVTTDLSGFDLIIPCGLEGRTVTSVAQILGENNVRMSAVRAQFIGQFTDAFDPERRYSGKVNQAT
jgi:lipoyl(octanoyl) transferase